MKITCHCRNVEIEVKRPQELTICNCSICSRYQALWGYYTPEEIKIRVGSAGTSNYVWGDKELAFVHCAKCGCVTHYQTLPGQPDPRIAVNFRMAFDQSLAEIPLRYFDGKSQL